MCTAVISCKLPAELAASNACNLANLCGISAWPVRYEASSVELLSASNGQRVAAYTVELNRTAVLLDKLSMSVVMGVLLL
jgi:hypothetical protein